MPQAHTKHNQRNRQSWTFYPRTYPMAPVDTGPTDEAIIAMSKWQDELEWGDFVSYSDSLEHGWQ